MTLCLAVVVFGGANYKPATEAVDKLKQVFMDAKPGLGTVEAENLVADVYKNATLPAGFKLDKSTDVIFKDFYYEWEKTCKLRMYAASMLYDR